jgi:hypothetical protein
MSWETQNELRNSKWVEQVIKRVNCFNLLCFQLVLSCSTCFDVLKFSTSFKCWATHKMSWGTHKIGWAIQKMSWANDKNELIASNYW